MSSSDPGVTGSFSPADLSALFTDIGEQLAGQDGQAGTLRSLADIAAERVPGAMYAGITVGRAGSRFETIAATDELVERTDSIQYELQSGPCVDAIVASTTFKAVDLRTDRRWPEFGTRAFDATGVVSMLSLRLFVESDLGMIAGLNLYSLKPGAFDSSSQTVAVLLATHGSLAIGRAAKHDKAQNLEIALNSSREIGIAMGILMSAAKVTREQAFNLLRIVSQNTHRKLADIAAEVAETGALPEIPHAH